MATKKPKTSRNQELVDRLTKLYAKRYKQIVVDALVEEVQSERGLPLPGEQKIFKSYGYDIENDDDFVFVVEHQCTALYKVINALRTTLKTMK
jgi:hypothetical protein